MQKVAVGGALVVGAAAVGCALFKYVSLVTLVIGCCCALGVMLLALLCRRAVHFLSKDEQLRVLHFTEIKVHNGPGLVLLNPLTYRSAQVVKVEILGPMQYAKIRDSIVGSERIERGPRLLLLGPHDEVTERGSALSLTNTDYLLVEDLMSGEKSVVKGPCMWFPGPHEKAKKGSCITLGPTEYIVVQDGLTGKSTIEKGPLIWCPGPYTSASSKQTAIALQDDEYIQIKDVATGQRWIQKGKALVFLEPNWQVGGKGSSVKKAWVLKVNEYIRLQDSITGQITVHRGEATVFPGPNDELLDGGIKKAVEVDEEHAALVRDNETGQLRLETEKQLFVPGPNETVEEVRELIKLMDHEAIIIKDKDGVFNYYYGNEAKRSANQPRSFFLPPHAEIVQNWWSRGPRRERKDVSFERFDMRPHLMKFEFNCRTADNVELILEGVFFWELVDLPTMIRQTGDTSGDIVYHIRSQFIQQVARTTLKVFMEDLHAISKNVLEEDTDFYSRRGLKIDALEVTRYHCADKSTSEILEQIIQETTNRMNRLSQVESENEVNLFRTQGQIEQSKLHVGLQEIQHKQSQAEARIAGIAEADRVASFLSGIGNEVPLLEDRIKIWQTLRKTEALSVVSNGGANLYYTPNDVDLSIETRSAASKGAPAGEGALS